MLIASTEDGTGAFALAYDFSQPIVVTKQFSSGGVTLYSSTVPGFDALAADQPDDGLFVLNPGATVRCLIRALLPFGTGVSLNINGTTIHDPGEAATIGTAPDLHVDPTWRLALLDSEPVLDEYRVTFRLIGSASGYGPSAEYQAIIVIDPASLPPSPTPTSTMPTATITPTVPTPTATIAPPSPTPTATAEATATVTPGGVACPGDCDGDDRVAIGELVRAVNIALGTAAVATCRAADGDGDGDISINELVRAVAAALDGCG